MRLKSKVVATTLFIFISSITSLAVLIEVTNKNREQLKQVYEENVVPSEQLFIITESVQKIAFRIMGFIAYQIPAGGSQRDLKESVKQINVSWNLIKKLFKEKKYDKKVVDHFNQIDISINKLTTDFETKLYNAYVAQDRDLAEEIMDEEWPIIQVPLINSSNYLIDYFKKQSFTIYSHGIVQAKNYFIVVMVIVILVILAIVLNGLVSKTFLSTLLALQSEARKLIMSTAKGDLKTRGSVDKIHVEFVDIISGMNNMLENTAKPIEETSRILNFMAAKDLSHSLRGEYLGEYGLLKQSLNKSLNSLNYLLKQFAEATNQVKIGGEEVAMSSQDLADGSNQQVLALSEISNAMNEISEQSIKNADNAKRATDISHSVKELAVTSCAKAQELEKAMEEITESSHQIININKIVDEIAFQTNLLALNASVEAARAGRHGKGFAIVADEVRKLAQRSAHASQETAKIIKVSNEKIERGIMLAKDESETLDTMVTSSVDITKFINEISFASNIQSGNVTKIVNSLKAADKISRDNMVRAEVSAAASEELSGQSQYLKDMIDKFIFDEAKGA